MHKRRRFDCGDDQDRVEIGLVLQPRGKGNSVGGGGGEEVGFERALRQALRLNCCGCRDVLEVWCGCRG